VKILLTEVSLIKGT